MKRGLLFDAKRPYRRRTWRRLLTLCGTADQPVYPVSSLLSAASRKADNVSYVLDFFARRIALNRARFF